MRTGCELDLFNLEKTRLRGNLIGVFWYLKGAYRKAWEGLFIRAGSDRMRVNGFKLEEGRFRLEIRKTIFYYEGGETLEHVAQESCGCSIP